MDAKALRRAFIALVGPSTAETAHQAREPSLIIDGFQCAFRVVLTL